MRFSIIVCTWNRSAWLRRTLQSFCALTVPADGEWEIVVVNNNSTDDTDSVIAAFENRLPLRRVFEKQLGLSKARNAGVRAARGDLLLFTDDDVECASDWLCAYGEAAARWPHALYFGGVVSASFTGKIPAWLARNRAALRWMLCECDYGKQERIFEKNEFPFGPNMALRRSAFEMTIFNEQVGRKGHAQLRGSETSAFYVLDAAGAVGVWVPSARMRHVIPARHTTARYLWNYYFGIGRTAARLGKNCSVPSRRRLAVIWLKALAHMACQPKHWPIPLSRAARLSGQFYETQALCHARAGSTPGEKRTH
jgi:glycosyltransferase involved in cell wall biosynthesis